MSDIQIYTDGGCSGNPGPGAWAYIILQGGARLSGSAAAPDTTNNRMELAAVIAALEQVPAPGMASSSLEFTDSSIAEGDHPWIRPGTPLAHQQQQPVKNQDLWQRLRQLSSAHPVQWHWLAGHAGHPLNEECDRLVRQAIARQKT
jgi:ribonuclease HI